MSQILSFPNREPYHGQTIDYVVTLLKSDFNAGAFIATQIKRIYARKEVLGEIMRPLIRDIRLVKLEHKNDGNIVIYAYHMTKREVCFIKGFTGRVEDNMHFIKKAIDDIY